MKRHVLVASVVLGCGGENASDHSASASAPAARSGIVFDGTALLFDGEPLAAPDTHAPILSLHAALQARREAWKKASPQLPFPGAVEIDLPAAVSCRAALGIVETCSGAGFPNLTVRVGGVRHELGLIASELVGPDVVMPHLWFRTDGSVEIRRERCGPPYDVVATTDVFAPLHKLLPQSPLGGARVGCDPAVPFSTVLAAFDEHDKQRSSAHAPMSLGFYTPCVLRAELAPTPASERGDLALKVEVTSDEGGIGAAPIKTAVDGVRDRLLGCYAAAHKQNPDISDTALLDLEIGDKGRPVGASANVFDAAGLLEECLRVEARGLVIDPPPSTFVKVSLRLTFGGRKR